MGRRSRRRAHGPGAPASTTDYRDPVGNVLTLRDELSAGTLRSLRDLDAKPAASAEDRWQRRLEFLFERPETGPPDDADEGWGLFLVEQLADEWGVDSGRRAVWFRIDCGRRGEGESESQSTAA